VAFFTYFGRPSSSGFESTTEVVPSVPSIGTRRHFLGTMGMMSGHFDPKNRDKVLAGGPGRIVGTITMDGKPRSGVRIRLLLNEAVMSQWATSGDDGRYSVAVPYGDYEIDGFELDPTALEKTLAGKTDNPRSNQIHGEIKTAVAAGKSGEGIDLDYIDPVVVTGPTGDVSLSHPIVLSWKPYPKATSYRIQLTEFKRQGDFRSQRYVFDWPDKPETKGTTLDLTAAHASLKKGFYYLVDIEALDDSKAVISTSGNRFLTTDFHVEE
jgi:hypothetical protein